MHSHSITFVDSALASDQSLMASVNPRSEIILLDPYRDGLAQISDALAQRSNISSLHIISHGSEGVFNLGQTYYDANALSSRTEELASWSTALTDDADLLFYGCNVASGESGIIFVNYLSHLTGADVAASDDLTGSAALGGNWNLEVATGAIESSLGFQSSVLDTYAGVLIRIQAEDYRAGGQGVAYSDTTPANLGGASYRPGDGVDIEGGTLDVGGGFNLSYVEPGEWLTYSLTLPIAGTYDLAARVASALDGPFNLQVSLNGTALTTLSFVGTGGWQTWTDAVTRGLSLAAGTYTLRVDTTTGGFNFNYIDFLPNTSSTIALRDSATVIVSEGAGVATVTAIRTGNTQERATVEYTTNEIGAASSAQAGLDFTQPTLNGRANTGLIVFEVGETEKTFTIPIVNDPLVEGDESFAVGLQNSTAGSLGAPRTVLIKIVDDDGPNTIAVSEAAISLSEGVPTVTVTVERRGNISGTASVNFSTSNGTAIAGSDYTATAGTLTFAANQVTRTISIPILNDTIAELNETFSISLSSPTGAALGSQATSTITILDNDGSVGNLTRSTVVSGLTQPTTLDWTPDGRYMMIAQKNGIVRVVDNGTLLPTALINLSTQVNDISDRGMLGLAVHPNFPSTPYVYLLYTYDPPEAAGLEGLGGLDGGGNRPARLVRVTVNPATMVADPASMVVLAGTNSTWAYTSRPDTDSTGDRSIPPSGIVNGTTIVAPADQIDVGTQDNDPDRPGIQNQNIRDYLAGDSTSHTIGALHFGSDGYLYFSNGDGISYNFMDPRGIRVQDIDNLSGKMLRIDPITGQGVPGNPFFEASDPNSNQSKVFYYGLRNPFRFTFDPVTTFPVIGEVGWNSWEEINTGVPGTNFGWPYFEGPNRTGGYRDLPQAISFYNNGDRNNSGDAPAVLPILPRSHGAPDNDNAIVVGDFFNNNTLMFGDLINGTMYAATLNDSRAVSSIQVFDSGIPYIVDMEMGPDGRLYGVDLPTGTIVRWNPA